jgi:hypothetical protein
MAQKITFASPHTVAVIVMEARELSMLLRLQWSVISVSGIIPFPGHEHGGQIIGLCFEHAGRWNALKNLRRATMPFDKEKQSALIFQVS